LNATLPIFEDAPDVSVSVITGEFWLVPPTVTTIDVTPYLGTGTPRIVLTLV
jgi:hypothetical protein